MTRATSSKVKQCRDTQATNAIASSLAKEARSSSIANTDKTCSNRGSGKDKCSNNTLHSDVRIEDKGLGFYFIFSYVLLLIIRQRRQNVTPSQAT